MPDLSREADRAAREKRNEALRDLEAWLDGPVLVLGFVWLALMAADLLWGLDPVLQGVVYTVWFLFLVDFALRFTLAPDKGAFLRANALTVLSLALPALRAFRLFRVFRVLRAAKAARGLKLVQVVGSVNRGMGALRASMRRRGAGYVALSSVLVTLAGAAGMTALEREAGSQGFATYGDALWWTAMIMTTMGSEAWPRTPEGRILGFALALYAFAVFGYVTASIASILVGDDMRKEERAAGAEDLARLKREIALLREELGRRSERRE